MSECPKETITFSRRATRHARKGIRFRLALMQEPPVTDSADSGTSDANKVVEQLGEPLYECFACGDGFPFETGIVTCAAHLMCQPCLLFGATVALTYPGCFPAQCCGPLSHYHVEQVLSPEKMALYERKALEIETPRALRVYCYNNECQRFIATEEYEHSDWHSIARCICRTNTCVGCKSVWEGDSHRCENAYSTGSGRPHGLPDYTADCRIKLCPECRLSIEHKEACNHMTCVRCRYDFCFICLLPWTGFHDEDGCPQYGDPSVGYDEDGFERSARGIHLDTGLDRNGLDRLGHDRLVLSSPSRGHNQQGFYEGNERYDEDQNLYDEEDPGFFEEEDQEFYDEGEEEGERRENNEDVHLDGDVPEPPDANRVIYDRDVQADEPNESQHVEDTEILRQDHDGDAREYLVAQEAVATTDQATMLESNELASHNQAEPQDANEGEVTDEVAAIVGMNTTPPSAINRHPLAPATAADRLLLHLQRHVPIFQPPPSGSTYHFYSTRLTFTQEDCCHRFGYREYYYRTSYSQATCPICRFTMRTWFNYCIDCGVVICDWCSGNFRGRSEYWGAADDSRVSVVQWAEDGAPPPRAALKRHLQAILEEFESDDADWGVRTMIDVYEEELYQLQPFLYHDLGTRLMFEELERQVLRCSWYVVEENVGLEGAAGQMSVRMDTNYFAPLLWEDAGLV